MSRTYTIIKILSGQLSICGHDNTGITDDGVLINMFLKVDEDGLEYTVGIEYRGKLLGTKRYINYFISRDAQLFTKSSPEIELLLMAYKLQRIA